MARTRSSAPSPLRLLGIGLALLVAAAAAATVATYRHLEDVQAGLQSVRAEVAGAGRLQVMVSEAQAAKRLWVLTGREEDREAASRSAEALAEAGRAEALALAEPLRRVGLPGVTAAVDHLLRFDAEVRRAYATGGTAAAAHVEANVSSIATAARIRTELEAFRRARQAEAAALDARLRQGSLLGLLLIGACSVTMLAMLLGALELLRRRQAAAEAARATVDRQGREVATLFRMGELLQASVTPDDVQRVVANTCADLLPELEGAFYLFNNSRDRLDLLSAWGHCGAAPSVPEHFGPADCWGLKRGRAHRCGGPGGLRCEHAEGMAAACLCIPITARGELHGVLQFHHAADGPNAAKQERLAQALADGVSLALANFGLREKLRNQALRDELTGLYNRRFLEETLPRLVAHAERRQASLAVLMLDLDHFKQVNDRHGHLVGDAVLREVGAMLRARLRAMDIACRYGGEELLVLMPDCAAEDALHRAEQLCGEVRALAAGQRGVLPAVTVSIGVAAWPAHGRGIAEVIKAADAALYEAKRQGRDRAIPARLAGAPALPVAAEATAVPA